MMKSLDVVILCGGLGKRLRTAVGESQKTMAAIDGRPFLDLQIDYLLHQGFQRIILSMGYHADEVKGHFSQKRNGLTVEFSQEEEPLGTGGAVVHAKKLIQSDSFVVLNGDSFCDVDYASFFQFHQDREALATMALARMNVKEDYGDVMLDEYSRIIRFQEKVSADSQEGWVNAGVYCFQKGIFSFMPMQERFSLEKDFFPVLIAQNFLGYQSAATFIDIGTPERYQKAQRILRKAE